MLLSGRFSIIFAIIAIFINSALSGYSKDLPQSNQTNREPLAVPRIISVPGIAGPGLKSIPKPNSSAQNTWIGYLKPLNNSAGYMLSASNIHYKLDAHGNNLAKQYILNRHRTKQFLVAVKGKLSGDTIIVSEITEVLDPLE